MGAPYIYDISSLKVNVGRLPEEEAAGFSGRGELICKRTRRHAGRGSYYSPFIIWCSILVSYDGFLQNPFGPDVSSRPVCPWSPVLSGNRLFSN